MIDGHGDDTYKYGDTIRHNFSSNIPKADLSELTAFLSERLKLVASYPEPDAASLALPLAEKLGISSENLCVTNGATEAIYLIARAFAGKRSLIVIPTFSEYEDACRINEHRLTFCCDITPKTDLRSVDMVWICNPNNPTGHTFEADVLRQIIASNPETLFVIDTSYAPFSRKPTPSTHQLIAFANVVVIGSMTKEYAVPGLRIGYFSAHRSLCGRLKKWRMPWSVNALAIEAGKFLLHRQTDSYNHLHEETERLRTALAKLPSIEAVMPTDTHFFLCKLSEGTASDLKDFLVRKHGILIRNAFNFRGLTDAHFRIASQPKAENDQLIEALSQWTR